MRIISAHAYFAGIILERMQNEQRELRENSKKKLGMNVLSFSIL